MSEEILNNETTEAAVDVIDGVAEKFVPNNMIVAGAIGLGALALGAAVYAAKKYVVPKIAKKFCKFHAWNEDENGEKRNETEGKVKVEETESEDKETEK